jgi:hypothetical protein
MTILQKIIRIDCIADEENIPFEDLFFIFGEKFIEVVPVNDPSLTTTRYKEHGPFTTQEAAQEYKDQHLLKEERWEVKQVSYPTKDEKRRTIWVIRHDL